MSSELLALIQRTQKQKPALVYRKPSSEPSPALLSLLGRMEARAWREETLLETVEYIKQTVDEIYWIRHVRGCNECLMEASLSVERYGGRCLPWFLDMINFEEVLEYGDNDIRYRDCPRAENYKFGSYWDKTTDHNEIIRFIKDRMSWAEKVDLQQISVASDYYKLLKEWDLNERRPIEESLPF